MTTTDLRAELIELIAHCGEAIVPDVTESADNDNVILITDSDGLRYKLTIERV